MLKKSYTDEFVLEEAKYINKSLATYRETAERFNMPLSTVGWHMKVRLKSIDSELHSDVMDIVHINYRLRNLRRNWDENSSILLQHDQRRKRLWIREV